MNTKLFKDLYELIKSQFPKDKITKDEFLYYLIGYYSTNPDTPIDYGNFSPDELADCTSSRKKLNTVLGSEYQKILKRNKNLKLKDLILITLNNDPQAIRHVTKSLLSQTDKITDLYKKYSIPVPDEADTEHLLLHLFSLCLYIPEKKKQLFASYKNQQLKPSTIKSTFGRDKDAEELKSILNQFHKIIISGQLGMGKSRFIQYCLTTWKLPDYCYIIYETDIKSTLHKILYQNSNGPKYKEPSAAALFDTNFSSSLLVIDNMYFSSDFSKELEYLSGMAVNIIIITINEFPAEFSNKFHTYALPALHDDILHKIFENDSGLNLQSSHLKGNLYEASLHNVLMVSLIASQCKKLADSASNQKNDNTIIEQVLTRLKHLNNHMDLNTAVNTKFKHKYDKESLNLIGHVKAFYNTFLVDNQENALRECMKQLCCFGCSPIPLEFVLTIPSACNINQLNKLSNMGFLTLTDETVQLSALISNAVFAAENPSPQDYDSLVEHICSFLTEYDATLKIPYLSDILYVFVQSLYDCVPIQHNPKQQNTSDRFEVWQELAYLISNYYNQNNNFELAQKIVGFIKYPDNLCNKHNPLDKAYIDLSNKMQMESEYDNIVSTINNLIIQTRTSENDGTVINLSFFALNQFDTFLNLFCQLRFRKDDARISNGQNYINIMGALLRSINDSVYFSKDKKTFYKISYWLITKYKSPKCFEYCLNYFKSFTNINYRIRGYAFIIFLQSVYSYESRNSTFFSDVVLSEIHKLSSLILECKLIPIQTFRLCLNAYIQTAIVQYTFISYNMLDQSKHTGIFNHKNCLNLLKRCNLSKEILDEAMAAMDSISSMFEKIRN